MCESSGATEENHCTCTNHVYLKLRNSLLFLLLLFSRAKVSNSASYGQMSVTHEVVHLMVAASAMCQVAWIIHTGGNKFEAAHASVTTQ